MLMWPADACHSDRSSDGLEEGGRWGSSSERDEKDGREKAGERRTSGVFFIRGGRGSRGPERLRGGMEGCDVSEREYGN